MQTDQKSPSPAHPLPSGPALCETSTNENGYTGPRVLNNVKPLSATCTLPNSLELGKYVLLITTDINCVFTRGSRSASADTRPARLYFGHAESPGRNGSRGSLEKNFVPRGENYRKWLEGRGSSPAKRRGFASEG